MGRQYGGCGQYVSKTAERSGRAPREGIPAIRRQKAHGGCTHENWRHHGCSSYCLQRILRPNLNSFLPLIIRDFYSLHRNVEVDPESDPTTILIKTERAKVLTPQFDQDR